MSFEACNFTHVPLQPSCAHSWLKPDPLSNELELAIVMALGQWSLLQSKKIAILPEMKALHGQKTVFQKTVHAKEERSSPPSADQGLSTATPRSSHVTWAQCWNPPTSLCPTLSAVAQNLSPKDIAGSEWLFHGEEQNSSVTSNCRSNQQTVYH